MRMLAPARAWSRCLLQSWLDDPGHDPAVLADFAVTGEPEFLVGRQSAVVEEAGGHRAGGLRVSLDSSPAQARDEINRPGERRSGHALTPVTLTDVAARDSPVRQGGPAFLVRRPGLDPGHLLGRAELTPADAILPSKRARRELCPLGLAVPSRHVAAHNVPAARRSKAVRGGKPCTSSRQRYRCCAPPTRRRRPTSTDREPLRCTSVRP